MVCVCVCGGGGGGGGGVGGGRGREGGVRGGFVGESPHSPMDDAY